MSTSVRSSRISKAAAIHPAENMNVRKAGWVVKKAKFWKKFTKDAKDKIDENDKKPNWLKEPESDFQLTELPADIQSRLICHVPDFVWSANTMVEDTPKAIMTNGVLLFADVSGFTSLTEKYSNDKEGVSGLTNALNGYISNICQHILDNGGDILKFAGDAILAVWKCERKQIAEAIAIATHTALEIQQQNDWKMTSVGVELRVKIAISAGKIYCTHVGMPGQMRHIAMSGNPVGEVNAAEKHCNSGDVVMSPNAWELCNRDIFKGFEVGDGLKFFKVSFMTHKKFDKWSIETDYQKRENVYCSRFACAVEENDKLTQYIRQYISPTVQAKLDDNQELNYLSEIRQCSILFINLVFDLKEQRRDYTERLGKTLQAAFTIVDDELRSFGGQLNKLFMFDKGCTFLAAFGLPGQKNEREAAFALECAFQISKRMTRDINELDRVSIGVTTGSVYVGVIGHQERHEYSFLGPKVNMAARIMMAGYPGMVNCDALTKKCSDLSRDFFIPQPYKALKGIKDPGVIYQYFEMTPPLTSYLRGAIKPEYPILGRISEIDHIMGEMCSTDDRCFVLIEGEKGIGKSRLLDEIVILSQNIDTDLHVVNICTSYDIMKDRFKIIRIIIEELLGIIDSLDREDSSFAASEILETLRGCKLAKCKDLLNPIFGTYYKGEGQTSTSDIVYFQAQLLQHIVIRCLDNFDRTVIVIDNGQFIDEESWPILNYLAGDSRAKVLIANRPLKKETSKTIVTITQDPSNLDLKLAPLSNEYFPALICQMLKVTQISKTLAAGMMYRSYGNPGWLLILLKKLRDDQIVKVEKIGTSDDEMHVPPIELTTARKLKTRNTNIDFTSKSTSKSRAISRGISTTLVTRSVFKAQKSTSDLDVSDFKHPAMQNETMDLDDEVVIENDYRATRQGTMCQVNNERYTNVLRKIGGYYESIMKKSSDENTKVEKEGSVDSEFKPLSKFISKIHAPEVIRSFILEQMDRLPPSTQFVCKCAALVGVYFSRQIIFSLVTTGQDRINKSFRELIEAKIIEPISSSTNQTMDWNPTRTTTSSFRRDSSLVNQIKFKTGYECDHLRFKNAFYREVIDQLWLNEHRLTLHHNTAEYFKRCIDELRACRQISETTIIEFAVNYQCSKDTIQRQQSISKILRIDLDQFDERDILYDKSKIKDKLILDDRGLSTIFTMSKNVQDTSYPSDISGSEKLAELDQAFGPKSIIWNRLMRLNGTIPVETELFLSVLCPILINHYMAGKKTEQTINFLLDATEAYLRIDSIKNALSYLDKVQEIISMLDKGYDIVKDVRDGAENFLNLDEFVYVYKVPKRTRARFDMLEGDARILQGNIIASRRCYDRALKLYGDPVNLSGKLQTISVSFALCKNRAGDDELLHLWNRIALQEVRCGPKMSSKTLKLITKRLRSLVKQSDIENKITANTNVITMGQLGNFDNNTIESDTIMEIMNIEQFQYNHVLKIFRFLHTMFYNRLTQGDIDGASEVVKCLGNIAEISGCKTLVMIARASLCEIYLINDEAEKLSEEISQIEMIMGMLGERTFEIECWLTIIKFNLMLNTGNQLETFPELVIWLLPFGSTAFSNLQWSSLASMISLINIRICQFDAAFHWMAITDNSKYLCSLSFHQARAFGFRVECDLIIYRNSLAHLKMEDWSFAAGREKSHCADTLAEYQFICKKFSIFQPYYHLYLGIFHYLNQSKSFKNEFLEAEKWAKITKNTAALKVIQRTISYYIDNDDDLLYSWTARVIYSGKFEKKKTINKDTIYIIPKV